MQAKEGINLPPVHHIGFSASNNPKAKHNGDVVTISDINTWEVSLYVWRLLYDVPAAWCTLTQHSGLPVSCMGAL
jgi:hypothetical protein